jgi:DNA-binding NarL/FixJ family response regulator
MPKNALLIGAWWPEASHTEMRSQGAEIYPCQDLAQLTRMLQDPGIGWLLFGRGIDDHHIEQTLWRTRTLRADVKVALLGGRNEWRRAERWIRRGCEVYLEWDTHPRRVLEVMHLVDRLRIRVIDSIFHQDLRAGLALSPVGLTRRESDVLHLLDQGMRNSEIAGALHISENTVEYHIRHILQKLGVRNRIEACRQAATMGLI